MPAAPLVPLPGTGAPSRRFSSSSSLRWRSSSRRCSSSIALRSAACCLCKASTSCSAISSLAPFHPGWSMSLWLCSVCESILVQLFSRVEALFTVCDTVYEILSAWCPTAVRMRLLCNTYFHITASTLKCPYHTFDHLVDMTYAIELFPQQRFGIDMLSGRLASWGSRCLWSSWCFGP